MDKNVDKIICTTLEAIQNAVGCDQDFLIRQDLPICSNCGLVLANQEMISILTRLFANEKKIFAILDLQTKIDQVMKKHLN